MNDNQPEKEEHPAGRAARMLKELHQQNIALMESGHVFTKDGENINHVVKAACEEQIRLCDEIIERAKNMDPALYEPAKLVLQDLSEHLQSKDDPPELPEIGNYGHKQDT